jgi:hypothetical protein
VAVSSARGVGSRCFGCSIATRYIGRRERIGRFARIISLFSYRSTEKPVIQSFGKHSIFKLKRSMRRK